MKRYELPGALIALLAAGPLLGAEAPGPKLTSPILGYIFDSGAQAIRSVSGVPGAASLGASVPLPAMTAATVHSGARIAIVALKDGGIALAAWGSEAAATPVPTELRNVTHVSFSRNGAQVALSDGETVETWTTRPQLALFSRQQVAGLTAVAVNGEGTIAATTSAGTVVLGDQDHIIASAENWSALAFANDDKDILASGQELVRLTRGGGRIALAPLAERAISIAASANGEFVAASLASGVLVVTANGAETVAGPAGGIDRLEGNFVIHIRGTAAVLDTDSGTPRVTTLPNISAVSGGGAN